ncbi:MAG: sulfatase [Chloroflexi bacterium]|nr:MAG: sulfatase [Chloroflexota bacterium]
MPDIVLIILDTQRRDRLSIYGHPQQTSPHLDEFATESTLFERAIAPAQWTVPSHASMFTGLYPSTHQVTQATSKLSGSYPTLAEILQADGYHTAGFCNNPLVGVLDTGLIRGFNQFFNYAGAAPNRPLDLTRTWVRRKISQQWRRFALHVSQYFARSDWLFRISLHPMLTPLWTRWVNYKGNTARSIDDLIDYHKVHRGGGQPLFLFLNLMGTHMPYRPPQDYIKRFVPDVDKAAYSFINRFNADAARWASPVEEPLSAWESHIIDGFYNAEVAHQDYHLGRLLRYLKDSGALEDTLVIIATDHGEGHGDHHFFGHSFVVYQELVHVPLVISYPQMFPVGKRIQTNVSTRRIFHTVLDVAGITPPIDESNPNADVKNLSLARSTNCAPDSENGLVFAEAFPPQTLLSVIEHHHPHLIESMLLTCVRRGVYQDSHKLAVANNYIEGLFDIAVDPTEQVNLAEQNRQLATDLQNKISAFVQLAQHYHTDSPYDGSVSPDVINHLKALGYIE